MNAIESQQICGSCEQAIRHGVGNLNSVPGLIKKIIKLKLWRERRLAPSRTVKLESFRELILKKPLDGWGEDPAKIEAIIRDDPEALALWREAMKGQPGRPTADDKPRSNATALNRDDRGKAYTVSRLQRDRPDLFEKVIAGELSANAAAIAAGWRKVKTPLELLHAAWVKASESERAAFLKFCASCQHFQSAKTPNGTVGTSGTTRTTAK